MQTILYSSLITSQGIFATYWLIELISREICHHRLLLRHHQQHILKLINSSSSCTRTQYSPYLNCVTLVGALHCGHVPLSLCVDHRHQHPRTRPFIRGTMMITRDRGWGGVLSSVQGEINYCRRSLGYGNRWAHTLCSCGWLSINGPFNMITYLWTVLYQTHPRIIIIQAVTTTSSSSLHLQHLYKPSLPLLHKVVGI